AAGDTDGDTLAFSVDTDPTHGTVSLDPATGVYTYTPDAGWSGVDSFVVLVDDGNGGQTPVTVQVTVSDVNDLPALADSELVTAADSPYEGQLPAATDADGDALSFSVHSGPAHGTLSLDAATGAYVYTPAPGYTGTDSFTVQVADGQGGTRLAVVQVTVQPAPTVDLARSSDLGVSDVDKVTTADQVQLEGLAQPGQTLRLYTPAGELLGTVVADADGRWALPEVNLATLVGDAGGEPGAPGAYTFQARPVLANGREGAAARLTLTREVLQAAPPEPPARPADPPPLPPLPEAPAPTAPPLPPPDFSSALGAGIHTALPTEAPRLPPPPAPAEREVNRGSSDIFTRPSGFQMMVRPAAEPALKLLNGMDDQVIKLGQRLNLQVPADTFVHTQLNETVTLRAAQANGQPLPGWLLFDGKAGTFTGSPPPGWNRDITVKLVARDSQGREVSTVFRIKVSTGTAERGAGLSSQLQRGEAWRAQAGQWIQTPRHRG
ncbi:tandem-95 repeat protein, partial [Ideonella livida]